MDAILVRRLVPAIAVASALLLVAILFVVISPNVLDAQRDHSKSIAGHLWTRARLFRERSGRWPDSAASMAPPDCAVPTCTLTINERARALEAVIDGGSLCYLGECVALIETGRHQIFRIDETKHVALSIWCGNVAPCLCHAFIEPVGSKQCRLRYVIENPGDAGSSVFHSLPSDTGQGMDLRSGETVSLCGEQVSCD
jgi:hypothetical protein